MATKVKGEAIKDGSVGLNALSQEVQDKINAGGGANWNAQEGEPGYINNKPFGDTFIKLEWYYDYSHDGVMCDTVIDKVFIDGKEYDLTLGDRPVLAAIVALR